MTWLGWGPCKQRSPLPTPSSSDPLSAGQRPPQPPCPPRSGRAGRHPQRRERRQKRPPPASAPGTRVLASSLGLRAQSREKAARAGGALPGRRGGGRGSGRNRWAQAGGPASAAAGVHAPGGGAAKVFPKDTQPRSPRSSARAPAKPPRRAHRRPARAPAPSSRCSGPTLGPEPARGRLPAHSYRAGGSNWCLPGRAPPFPGTKAAARARAPAETGCGAGSGGPGLGNGTPPGGAPKLLTPRVRVEGGAGAGSAGRARTGRRAEPQRGRHAAGTGTAGGPRAHEVGSAWEEEPRARARRRRVGNLLQSSDS